MRGINISTLVILGGRKLDSVLLIRHDILVPVPCAVVGLGGGGEDRSGLHLRDSLKLLQDVPLH